MTSETKLNMILEAQQKLNKKVEEALLNLDERVKLLTALITNLGKRIDRLEV